MRYHTVFLDEWVRVRNFSNSHFHACSPCSRCGTAKCVPVWYSFKTREVRCLKCFDAVGEHDRREDARWAERRRTRQGAVPARSTS
jgi:hypothetical protein